MGARIGAMTRGMPNVAVFGLAIDQNVARRRDARRGMFELSRAHRR